MTGGVTRGPVVGGATTAADNGRAGGVPMGGGGSPPSRPWGSDAGVCVCGGGLGFTMLHIIN